MDDPKFPDKKVIRAPSLKRGRNEERITDRVKLEKVLGVTVTSNAALTSDNNGTVAYPAGCTVVLLNTRTEQQSHIINASRKTVTALSYSACGRYIVSGECGHAPAVRIWDLQSDPQTGPHPGLAPQPLQIAEFAGHKYGINCVAFSPCGKFVVSVGTQHDMIVNVWDWRNNVKVASNKVSTKVKAVSFAENGSYFVTVGNRHVKFWYLEYGKARYKEAVPLMGRSAILGEQRNNYFCDVACGKGECADSTFAITRSGLLCEFNNRRLLDKWVELRTTSANCIAVGLEYIFVGCSDSIVRCFSPSTLRFVTTLPRTHYLGVDVAAGVSITHMASPPSDARYPDTMALAFDQTNHKLTCIYNDHSVYVWDCNNVKRVGKAMSALYHSACIWGVEMPAGPQFPPGSFLTCGSDDTIRVWSLDKLNQRTAKGIYQPNVYSNELIKVIYVDPSLSYIKDMDLSCSGTTEKQQQQSNPSQTEGGSYDGRNGVRCIRVSPDGRHLASGDRAGNIRIYDTANMRELFKVEAHDSEVLCLEYSCPSDGARSLMASASRDRLLHVFDVDHGYQFLQTLDDHSSSITAVRFLTHPGSAVRMVSCGADKSLIFRTLNGSSSGSGKPQFNRENHATGKTTLYDMEVDSGGKHVLTACQDRQVRVYSAASGKHTKSFKGSMGDEGTLIKVALDRSGIYLATSCTDKSLSVYDYYSGECMASVCGHSELATGLRFTNDCRRLVSASGDGCVFVWRVPHDMVVTMHARLGQQALRHGRQLDREIFNDDASVVSVTPTDELFDSATTQDSNYRFSIGQLPQWAKKQLTEEPDQPPSLAKGVAVPKGRWAQRAEHGIKTLYSQPGPFPSLPFPAPDRRLDSDGSKDSSLDSGMDVKQYVESSKIITKQSLSTSHRRSAAAAAATNVDVVDTGFESAAHDGDVESDTDSRPLYYPAALDPPSSGGEFPVTNADADELRRSQRKRRPLPPSSLSLAAPPPAASSPVSPGSLESDEDDDDASTPSGQETDHRGGPTSLLSASVESLEQLGSRERYFQATFDSMSGPEGGTPGNKSSISAQFLTRSGGERNTEAINAVLQTRTDPEVTRKRLELNKRIAETKRKLESVGMSSPLKYSQSIHDLSRIPDRDKKWGHNSNSKQAAYLDVDAESPDSSLRRSCSLSDLSAQGPPVLPVPPKRRPAEGKRNAAAKEQPSRQQSRYTKGASLQIGRSRSSTVLNYSDSEPETHDKRVSRLMRPTISSYNKAAAQSRPAREKHSYSTSNLNSVGVDNGSTSDDENEAPRPAPRSRPVSFAAETPSGRSRSYRDSKAKRHTIHFDLSTVHSPPNLNGTLIGTYNETSAPLTPVPEVLRPNVSGSMSAQLCQEVIEQLTTSAEGVVEMYQRLSGNGSDAAPASAPPPSGEERRRDDLVRGLETSIIRTHKLLNDCIFRKLKQNSDGGPDVNQTDAVKKLHDLVAKGGPCSVVSMMEQYSDILLDLVQQKMHHVNIP